MEKEEEDLEKEEATVNPSGLPPTEEPLRKLTGETYGDSFRQPSGEPSAKHTEEFSEQLIDESSGQEKAKESPLSTLSTEEEVHSYDVFDLIIEASLEKKRFMQLASFKPVDKEKIAKRCSPFPFRPPQSFVTELYKNDFELWVGKTVKGLVSQKATIDQASQFVAFCNDKLKRKLR
jgi:hypothetical protein